MTARLCRQTDGDVDPLGLAAKFASPLIVSVPKKDVKAIEFHENGKKVETVKVNR